MVIREVDMIQWLIKTTLDRIEVTLCSDTGDLLTTTVVGLNLDVQVTYKAMELSANLTELNVVDRIENTIYRKVSQDSWHFAHDFLVGGEMPKRRLCVGGR